MKAFNIAKKVLIGIVAALCAVLLVYNAYMLIAKYACGIPMPTVFGYAGARVPTGSMDDDSGDDDIEIGDFVIIHAQDSYEIGDVVTFYDVSAKITVTHRVVDIVDTTYYIRGDTTGYRDENGRPITEGVVTDAVPLENIIGKVVGVIPGFGGFIEFMQKPYGLLIVCGIGVLIWLGGGIIDELLNRKNNEKESE